MSGMTLKLKRIESRLTQKEMAEKIGVSIGAIQKWEQNINQANVGKLKKAADLLGCTVDDLIS